MPGRTLLIKELKEKFDCAEKVVFDISQVDVHTVASLLKLYFRELPQSIIPATYYQKFMNIALHFQGAKDTEDRQKAVNELREYVKKIPEDNFYIVLHLCRFLKKVSDHSDVNKMSILNLATVFGPNIIRNVSEADSAELMMATADITQQLAFMMIQYNEEVFDKEIEIPKIEEDVKSAEVPVDDLLGLEFGGGEDYYNNNEVPLTPEPAERSLLHQLSEELQGIDFFGTGEKSPTDDDFAGLRNSMGSNHSRSSSKEGSPKPEVPPKPVPPQRKNKMSKILRNKRLGSEKNRELIVSSASSTTSEEHRKVHYLETSFDDAPVNGVEDDIDGSGQVQSPEEWLEKELAFTKEKYEQEIAKLSEKCDMLEQQNKTSLARFSEMKSKYDRQIKDLNKNMSVITSRYEARIASMDAVHKDTVRNLEEKLASEKLSREDAVNRVINLQAQLQQYHLHYGEIGN